MMKTAMMHAIQANHRLLAVTAADAFVHAHANLASAAKIKKPARGGPSAHHVLTTPSPAAKNKIKNH